MYRRKKTPMEIVHTIVRRVDVVVEVLDARDPYGTRCPGIEKYADRLGKAVIFAVNKCDLASPESNKKYKQALSGIAPAIFVSAKERKGTRMLLAKIRMHSPAKKLTKVALVGYPNVGKSMLANALKGRRSAGVAPVPGYTKNVQWVSVAKDIRLHDLPGVFPRTESESTLALKGAISADKIKDPEAGAAEILGWLLENSPEAISDRYKIELTDDPYELLERIGRARGKLLKGGIVDTPATARIVIQEWTTAKLQKRKEA